MRLCLDRRQVPLCLLRVLMKRLKIESSSVMGTGQAKAECRQAKTEGQQAKTEGQQAKTEGQPTYEGYWASSPDPAKDTMYKGQYPWPSPCPDFHDKEIILRKLNDLEKRIESDAVNYRGYSECRLCDLRRNGSREFVLKTEGGEVHWPEGLRHYIEAHNVRPSPHFIELLHAQVN